MYKIIARASKFIFEGQNKLKDFSAINLVCRDPAKRTSIIAETSKSFKNCYVLDCAEDINKVGYIVLCTKKDHISL